MEGNTSNKETLLDSRQKNVEKPRQFHHKRNHSESQEELLEQRLRRNAERQRKYRQAKKEKLAQETESKLSKPPCPQQNAERN